MSASHSSWLIVVRLRVFITDLPAVVLAVLQQSLQKVHVVWSVLETREDQ